MSITCLIAAHDPWFIQLLRVYALEFGFRIVQAFEGQDVLPIIHQEHPAAVFLQHDLPGQLKSNEIIKLIKDDPEFHDLHILIFSQGSLSDDEVVDCQAIHLQEPVSYEVFQEALLKVGFSNPTTSNRLYPSVKNPDVNLPANINQRGKTQT